MLLKPHKCSDMKGSDELHFDRVALEETFHTMSVIKYKHISAINKKCATAADLRHWIQSYSCLTKLFI